LERGGKHGLLLVNATYNEAKKWIEDRKDNRYDRPLLGPETSPPRLHRHPLNEVLYMLPDERSLGIQGKGIEKRR